MLNALDHATGRFEGKVALITGAASGIGQAVARHFAAQGATLILNDFAQAPLEALLNELNTPKHETDSPRIHSAICSDLSQAEGCQSLITQALTQQPRIDILVNNAGIQRVHPIESFPLSEWQTLINLMLTAPFLLTQGLWPAMKANGFGRIINMASIHALVASPYKSAYVSAKHGLLGLTKTAALEGGEHGITVNALCPAYVKTPLVEQQIQAQASANSLSTQAVIEEIMLAPAAIKRLIEPEEVAAVCAFLCSEAGAAVTGASWSLDLGWTAR